MYYECEDCGYTTHDFISKCPDCNSKSIYMVSESDNPVGTIDEELIQKKVEEYLDSIKNKERKQKETDMIDTGERMEFETGAIREPHKGKGRYDLISTEGLMRLAAWYERGAEKYGDRNWEKGLPVSNCMNSLLRHAIKYLAGWDDEDHLAAIAWNAFAIMEFEKTHPELQDLPKRKKRE